MKESGVNQGLYSAFRRVMYLMQFRQAVLEISYRRKAFIFVRKTLRVRLRDRVGGSRLRRLAGKDLRFSMKIMFAPVSGAALQPA